jgi:hypothetical protein
MKEKHPRTPRCRPRATHCAHSQGQNGAKQFREGKLQEVFFFANGSVGEHSQHARSDGDWLIQTSQATRARERTGL